MPREGVMLAYQYEQARLDRWLKQVPFAFVQPKYNGRRLRWDGQTLWTSEGNVCVAVPALVADLEQHFLGFPLDGEGYVHGWSKEKIDSVYSRTANLHDDHEKAQFHTFDLPLTATTQQKRLLTLVGAKDLIERLPRFKLSPVYRTNSHTATWAFVKQQVELGYEGGIIRHPLAVYEPKKSVWMMKWKPGGSDTYKLIEMIEGEGKYAGTLGAMWVEDQDGQRFKVGSFSIPDNERARLWSIREELEGKVGVLVRYSELTEKGIPPSGVYKSIVKGG